MDDAGTEAKGSLWTDASSDSPSISGAAYQVLLDMANRSRPDFTNDPVLNLTKDTYENIDLIAEGFGDCSAETIINEASITAHVPDYYTCSTVNKPTGGCVISHIIEIDTEPADVVFLIDNSASMGSVISDLRNNVRTFAEILSQGNSENLRLGGATIRVDDYLTRNVDLTYSIDEFSAWIDAIRTDGAPTYPFDAIAWAADHFEWRDDAHRIIILVGNDDVGGDKENAIERVAANSVELYVFHDNNETNSIGTHLADYFSGTKLLKFAQFLTVVKDSWSPKECVDAAVATLEEFCEGSYTPTPTTDDDCVNISGFEVCRGDPIYERLDEPPVPNVPKLASTVDVSALQCDFNRGQGTCWTDPQGNEQCLENYQDVDQCQEYEDNPQCGYISSECVDGATGSEGTCYVYKNKYDCGEDVEVPTLEKETQYQCGGPISCMGDECLDVTTTQSTDFARASALLNAAQFMTQDMSCEDVTGETNVYCRAFSGEAGECKIAVGGVQDCCEQPSNVSLADYLTMITSVPKLDGAVLALEDTNVIKSSYQTLRQPVMNAWTEVSKPFTSHMDNISGAVEEIWSPIEELKQQLIEKLKEQAKKMLQDVMGSLAQDSATEAAATAAADQAAEEMVNEMATQAASMLGAAMTIYTIYVVAVAIIQIVWACEQAELEMNTKRALKSCTYVGSYCKTEVLGACIEEREAYCCFNSPLSRIVQEQVRSQLGTDFGDAESPQCEGIPLDEISSIDWSQIDLTEWLGILEQNGQLPSVDNVSMDALTGSGSVFNIDGDRQPADQRAMDRVDDIDVDAKRREAMEMIQIDPGDGT
ncbi:conjugal transfer mating pair stabilization protein TraN [Marinobacterium aestuariivivens]|uniref:Conjugal transfer mating pair stabilization protein TraN n=2 Tax=Marinobacterium aestuariivivens TaxID=1698799 RepID=A0ABW2A9R6_9GAMM